MAEDYYDPGYFAIAERRIAEARRLPDQAQLFAAE
jgi:hypothetical protein